jgi:hypothetical protein
MLCVSNINSLFPFGDKHLFQEGFVFPYMNFEVSASPAPLRQKLQLRCLTRIASTLFQCKFKRPDVARRGAGAAPYSLVLSQLLRVLSYPRFHLPSFRNRATDAAVGRLDDKAKHQCTESVLWIYPKLSRSEEQQQTVTIRILQILKMILTESARTSHRTLLIHPKDY